MHAQTSRTIGPYDYVGSVSMASKRNDTASDAVSFGKTLARIRRAKGITQAELAERIGITQPNVSHYEKETFRPNSEMLQRIAQVLDVSTDVLLGRKAPRHEAPVVSRKLLRRMQQIEKLPKRDQDALLRTIDAFIDRAG